MASIDEDPLAAFSEDLEDLRGKVDGLRADLEKTAAQMRSNFQTILDAQGSRGEDAAEETGEKAWAWWFPAMSAEEAQTAWDTLTSWLEEVRTRLPKLDKHLGRCPCWYRHPDAVDRLAALYVVWDGAYAGDSLASARAEYLERWIRATLQALDDINGSCVSSCELLDPPTRIENLSLDEFIKADVDRRRAIG